MKTYLLRGVPASVAADGWWLSGEAPRRPRPRHEAAPTPGLAFRAGALAALVALADLLLWQVAAPGLSLFVFGMAVLLAGWALAGQRGGIGLLMAALLCLPVIERVQALSLLFWFAGLTFGAAWIALARWPGLSACLRFLFHAPWLVASDLRDFARAAPAAQLRGGLRGAYLGWFLPLGLGLLFLSLLISANPLLENWLETLSFGEPRLDPGRLAFWAGMALLTWPFLSLRFLTQRLSLGITPPRARTLPALFNAASVGRSLILFNLVFAVQTLSDIAIFSGGASLPDGMSYAAYAHRGAYPLLLTALLAGAFALAARGFTERNRALRAALLFWMMQTLFLVLSSLIRLDSYVSVYGLTHLRLAALVWMGVVALGIVLVIGQILRRESAAWLLKRCVLLGIGTLYLCSFSSFAGTVARYNLSHDVVADPYYLCALDSAALPAIVAHEQATGRAFCHAGHRPRLALAQDWREWGFRDWRTARSLAKLSDAGRPWPTY